MSTQLIETKSDCSVNGFNFMSRWRFDKEHTAVNATFDLRDWWRGNRPRDDEYCIGYVSWEDKFVRVQIYNFPAEIYQHGYQDGIPVLTTSPYGKENK